ncbi:MAG TPA: response regulator [Caulobacteraceae bacterium]|nr:response regulator [Caulobacteraceae bacterium]
MTAPGAIAAGRRIIVVEDEMMIAMLLEDMLADLGHTVVGVAGRLDSALDLARTAEADLAILDVNLSGEASFPVAQVLSDRGLPFMFATGYGALGIEAPFQSALTLKKPFVLSDLSKALDSLAA